MGNLTAQNTKIDIKYIKRFFVGECGKLAQIYAFWDFYKQKDGKEKTSNAQKSSLANRAILKTQKVAKAF